MQRERKPEIKSLNGLRFVAAMAVVVYHYFAMGEPMDAAQSAAREHGPIGAFLASWLPMLHDGHLAVDFFAILSGFVLSYAYADDVVAGRFDCGEFMRRRFARIYPLHFATLLFCVAMGAAARGLDIPLGHPESFAASAILPNIMMTHSFGATHALTFNGPSWFISAEWFMYMAFPVLVVMLSKSGLPSVPRFVIAMALFLIAYYYWRPGGALLTHRTFNYGVVRVALEFLIGLTLYQLYAEYRAARLTTITTTHVLATGAAFLIAAQLRTEEGLTVMLFPFFIFSCAAAEASHGLKWMTHPWLIYGGQLSFAIYMIHMPFIASARKALEGAGLREPASLSDDLLSVTCLLLVVPFGWIVYRAFERPFRGTVESLQESKAANGVEKAPGSLMWGRKR